MYIERHSLGRGMIMTTQYKVEYYEDSTGKSLVRNYIHNISDKREKAKIIAMIEHLRINNGYLEEPQSRHLDGKMRELRIKRHRIIYALMRGRLILLLYGFFKETQNTPPEAIKKAEQNLKNYER